MFEAFTFNNAERRDTSLEDEALRWLRKQPELLRLQFVTQVVELSYPGAHEFIRRSQLSPESLEKLFRSYLATSDTSTISLWLKAVSEGLGWRRVIDVLQQQLTTNVVAVEHALYWLPSLLPPEDTEAKKIYEGLRDDYKKTLSSACRSRSLLRLFNPLRNIYRLFSIR